MVNKLKYNVCIMVCLIFFGHTITSCRTHKNLIALAHSDQAKREVLVVAHRANIGDDLYPENSLKTIEHCIASGADILELDIRETKDQQLVIFHDKTLNRTTNGEGNVAEISLEELKKLRLKHQDIVTDFTVPTLDEVLKLAKGKVYLDLDIKLESEDSYKRIVDLLRQHQMEEEVLLFLYDKLDIERMHKLAPKTPILARVYNKEDIAFVKKYPFIRFIHIDEKCYDADLMKELINQGYFVWLNSLGKFDQEEVSGRKGFATFFNQYQHVNIVQTDYAQQLKQYLKSTHKNGLNN